MPDLYMPSVVVEIAFNAGYTTPAASRTWTDVSDYVELDQLLDIVVGRQDERSTADANQLTLTLDNSDGRFTAQRTASPYYPNVKIGRPIRVRATPPSGTTSTRFVGFIDEWPVEWDGSDRYAMAKIRATSRLARLGLNAKLRSVPEQEVLASEPAAYWTLGDASGALTASEATGIAPALVVQGDASHVVFGSATGPSTDGITAAQFISNAGSTAPGWLGTSLISSSAIRGLRCSLRVLTPPPGVLADFLSVGDFRLSVRNTGQVQARIPSIGVTLSGGGVNDGLTHDVAFFWDGTTAWLVVDGTIAATGSSTTYPTGPPGEVVVGIGFDCVIAHVAVWDATSAVTTAAAADQAVAMTTGFAGDTTDQRLVRILEWAGVAASEVTTDTGAEAMAHQDTAGKSVVDALREVESTEGGVLFDGPDGQLRFHNRSHRYLATAAATLNMASQHVGSDYAPKLDRSALVNEVTVTNPTTQQTARAIDSSSQAEYGIASASATSTASALEPLQQKAYWLVASYAEPRVRVPSLSVDVLAHQGLTPSAQTLLGVGVGDLIAVTNAPTQADSTSATYFVEGYKESIGPESYSITYNLSPSYPTLNTFVLGDATRGKLDDAYVLAL